MHMCVSVHVCLHVLAGHRYNVLIRSFKPLDLPDNLYPHRYPGYVKKEADVDTGPFIFSSLRLHKKKKSSEGT